MTYALVSTWSSVSLGYEHVLQLMQPWLSAYSTEGWLRNFHFSKLLSYENAHDCYPTASHCFSSLIWLSRNKSVQKSRFSRIVRNSREFSILDLNLEAFWFHFSLLEKVWKHFIFTLHFSKKSESIFFHFALLEKEWKLFVFTFHFSNFKNQLSLVPASDPSEVTNRCITQQYTVRFLLKSFFYISRFIDVSRRL